MNQSTKPRAPRVSTSIEAVLVDSDGGELFVEVVDLSSGGFRLRAGEQLVVGEEVRLRVPRYGDLKARIQWVKGSEAGGWFLEPVVI